MYDTSVSPLYTIRLPDDGDLFWYRDDMHNPYPISPLGMTMVQRHYCWGYHLATEQTMAPSHGAYIKMHKGRVYLAWELIDDEKELAERAQNSAKLIEYCIDNWDEYYQKHIDEVKAGTESLACVDADRLTNADLLHHLQRADEVDLRNGEIHFILAYAADMIYVKFEDFCKKYGVEEREFVALLKGGEKSMAVKTDETLWKLAKLAEESGIGDMLLSEDSKIILNKLRDIPEGQKWLDSFAEFLKIFGNRLSAAHMDVIGYTWREDPTPVLMTIKSYIPRVRSGWDVEEMLEKVTLDSRKAADDCLARISDENERKEFARLLNVGKKIYFFQDDHNFYIDQVSVAEVHNAAMACGRRLVKYGLLERHEDVVFLTYWELVEVLSDLTRNEKVAARRYHRLVPPLVRERKANMEEIERTKAPPLTIGPMPECMPDPVAAKALAIVDRETCPKDEDVVSDKLRGLPGAPGVVEGVARVITTFEDFPKLQPGEILVCPATEATWTPLFLKIIGVVTNTGGFLSHTAVAASEHGIPAVVGTWNATKAIQDGDIIYVDGNKGIVEVRKRA